MPSFGAWKDQIKKTYKYYKDLSTLELEYVINKIIKNNKTVKKSVSDWPKILDYITTKFPKVDISNVPVYIVPHLAMYKSGINGNGCYVTHLDIILVSDKVYTVNAESKTVFNKIVNKCIGIELNVEDIVVHELLHAVSNRTGGLKSSKAEEEFVYTNCIPFYKSKGMTDKNIIDTIIIPFCFNDVMVDSDFISKMWNNVGVNIDEHVLKADRNKVYNKYAEQIVPIIVEESRIRAQNMIDLYYKYGQNMAHCNLNPKSGIDARLDTIDFGTEL